MIFEIRKSIGFELQLCFVEVLFKSRRNVIQDLLICLQGYLIVDVFDVLTQRSNNTDNNTHRGKLGNETRAVLFGP